MSAGLEEQRIGFIGCGAMARALCGGLIAGGFPATQINGSDPSDSQRSDFTAALDVETTADNTELVAVSDIIVLCTKPGVVIDMLQNLPTQAHAQTKLFISIAAGIQIKALESAIGSGSRVIRVMPNTPALIGEGVSVLCPNQACTEADRVAANSLFRSVGITWVAPEEAMMDAVTALSGSGPGYIFLLLEALGEAGLKQGLPKEAAEQLAFQTVLGAARLALESEASPADLRAQVTSPGGTTLAGLNHLEKAQFREAIHGAVEAATRRSRELGED